MQTVFIIAAILLVLYILLFLVFFFDLDGKLLYYVVEPLLCKHYDKMEHKDMTKIEYDTTIQDADHSPR